MEASELRIGNLVTIENEKSWLELKGKIMAVIGITKTTDTLKIVAFPLSKYTIYLEDERCVEYFQFNEFIQPIKITKEWLIKLGFVTSPAANSTYLSIPALKGEVHFEDFRKGIVCVLYCSTGSFIPTDIKYVHHLQNLYYALTGEELEIIKS